MGVGAMVAAGLAAASVGYSVYQAEQREDRLQEARQEARERREQMQTRRQRQFNKTHQQQPDTNRRSGRGGGVESTLLTGPRGVQDVNLGKSTLLGN